MSMLGNGQSGQLAVPEAIRPRVDGDGRFTCEFFCRHCRYPLVGIPAKEAVCPECGFPVAVSVEQYRRFWVSENWIAGQVRMQRWVATGFGVFILWFFSTGMFRGSLRPGVVAAWAAVGACVGLFVLMKLRGAMEVPLTFGNDAAEPEGVGIGAGERLAYVGFGALVWVWVLCVALGQGRMEEVSLWGVAMLMVLGVSWQQIAWARMIKRSLAGISLRPVGPYYWMAYVPSILLGVGAVGLRPWVVELSVLQAWWKDAALIALSVWMWVMIVVPLMVLASAWIRLSTLTGEAVWTRMQAREAMTQPEGYTDQMMEPAAQHRTARSFARSHALLSKRDVGMYKEGAQVF